MKPQKVPMHTVCGHQLHPHGSLLSRDRFRTMTNVLGDALAAGIIAHVCEKDFAPKAPRVSTACLGEQGHKNLCSPQIKMRFSFLQQDPVSTTDNCPAGSSQLHPKDSVIEIIEETLLDRTGVHYNICQV